MKFELWQAFVLGAVLSWGAYVPVLHEGQTRLGYPKGPGAGAMRAFLCVGIAYLLTAGVDVLGGDLAGRRGGRHGALLQGAAGSVCPAGADACRRSAGQHVLVEGGGHGRRQPGASAVGV